jgi:hypothetical protein
MPTIEKSNEVNVQVRTAYNQWTQFEEFPHFMDGFGLYASSMLGLLNTCDEKLGCSLVAGISTEPYNVYTRGS